MKRLLAIILALAFVGCAGSDDTSFPAPVPMVCGAGGGVIGNPFVICSQADLKKVADNPGGVYTLGNDIALSEIWMPIGTSSAPFYGIFDGNGKKITGMSVNITGDYGGLFGYINGGSVSNLSIEGSVRGNNYVGMIVGRINNGSITKCIVNGSVYGKNYIGGLVGYAASSKISKSFSAGTVAGDGGLIGGIAGRLRNKSSLENSYSTANISGQNDIGGIVGETNDSTLTNIYAAGIVQGTNTTASNAGGIAGNSVLSVITSCVALNSKVGAIHAVGHVIGLATSSTLSDNLALTSMAIWGQAQEDTYIPLNQTDARQKMTYENIGWKFGEDDNSPWIMGTDYPKLFFIK